MDDNNSISIEKPKSIEKCNNSIKKSELSNAVVDKSNAVVDKSNAVVDKSNAVVDKSNAVVDRENDKIINDLLACLLSISLFLMHSLTNDFALDSLKDLKRNTRSDQYQMFVALGGLLV
jgi:hypothetical protein